MRPESKPKMIISVAGGKGGVGKSIFSVALGAQFAMEGNRVVLADLDLGAANVHTYLGIIKKTPTIADFILKKAPSLEDIMIDTSRENLKIISGAEFVPGMANPAHWMKLKIMRHIKALPADIVILDLGAGVHFNTLDFFGMSDRGIVVTAPEPGAVMNAYSFIKGALFRRLQNIFRKHPELGPMIDAETKKTGEESTFTLEALSEQIRALAPDMLPLIKEIETDFSPALVVNRIPEGELHVLVKNLIILSREKLGLMVNHAGNLPDVPEITGYLLRIPAFLSAPEGRAYLKAVRNISGKIGRHPGPAIDAVKTKADFSDDDVEKIVALMDTLDDSIFSDTSRKACRLRMYFMYFRPAEVVTYLINHGVKSGLFHGE